MYMEPRTLREESVLRIKVQFDTNYLNNGKDS